MNFSKDKYTLTSSRQIPEIRQKLHNNTLTKSILVKTRTHKPFIGQVQEDGFYLISSSKIGLVCTLKGKFANDEDDTIVELETKMHRAFIILFTCWSSFIIIAPIVASILNPYQPFSFALLPLLLIVVVGARFLLHYVYIKSRNQGVNKIQTIIEQS